MMKKLGLGKGASLSPKAGVRGGSPPPPWELCGGGSPLVGDEDRGREGDRHLAKITERVRGGS